MSVSVLLLLTIKKAIGDDQSTDSGEHDSGERDSIDQATPSDVMLETSLYLSSIMSNIKVRSFLENMAFVEIAQ